MMDYALLAKIAARKRDETIRDNPLRKTSGIIVEASYAAMANVFEEAERTHSNGNIK